MKQITLFIIIIALNSFANAQTYKFGHKIPSGEVLGVRIATTWNGTVTFFEGYYDGYRLKNVKLMPKNEFKKRILINIMDTLEVMDKLKRDSIPTYQIENYILNHYYLFPYLDSLWKLRYAVYPFHTTHSDTLGWTMNFKNPFVPTHKQKQILYEIGMDTTFYVIFGDNFFHLIKLMANPQWVNNYKDAH